MRSTQLRYPLGGDGATFLWTLSWGSGREADLERWDQRVVNSNTSRPPLSQFGMDDNTHWYRCLIAI